MPDIPIPYDPNSSPSPSVELIVHPTLGRDSVQFQQLVRYVEGLKDGKGPTQAARAAGTTLGAMKLQGRAVQKYLAKARSEYTAEVAEIRELLVLQWLERALREPTLADGSPNPGYDPRESMAALHELSLIPEVGLKGKSAALATVRELGEDTQAILDRLDEVEG